MMSTWTSSNEANALAERHLATISRWFDAGHAKQVIIARGYVAGGDYHKHYEDVAKGLGEWLKAIIDANASAHGVDPSSPVWA